MPFPDDIKKQLMTRAVKMGASNKPASGGAPPVGGPQGVFDVNGEPVTQLTLGSEFGVTITNGNAEISVDAATATQPGLMSAAQAAALDAISADKSAKLTDAVALTTNDATPVLAVTITGLGANANRFYALGVRVGVNSTASVGGYIDITTTVRVTTDGDGVATVELQLGTPTPDKTMLPSALSTATISLTMTTGGLTVWATRVAGTNMRAAECKVWLLDGFAGVAS